MSPVASSGFVPLPSLLPVKPGDRGTSRRIQNMGFVKGRGSDGVWMTLNGGSMQMSPQEVSGTLDPVFNDVSIRSGGFGIIDVGWKVRLEAGSFPSHHMLAAELANAAMPVEPSLAQGILVLLHV